MDGRTNDAKLQHRAHKAARGFLVQFYPPGCYPKKKHTSRVPRGHGLMFIAGTSGLAQETISGPDTEKDCLAPASEAEADAVMQLTDA